MFEIEYVTTYRGGQCWNDVAREALEVSLPINSCPDKDGWIVEHDRYGKWFMPRDSVVADWKQDQLQAYPGQSAREPSMQEVETWFSEQITWIEISQYGVRLEGPNLAAFEAAWMNNMKRDADCMAHFDAIEVKARTRRKKNEPR